MLIFRQQIPLITHLRRRREEGLRIGFVPTMGALHEGHLSLIRQSRAANSLTVCSIFVNPTQFNDPKDLEKYPRPVEKDMELLLEAGGDVLYLPSAKDVYGGKAEVTETFDFGGLENRLEGASRPGHFAGVAQVVKLLLDIVQPDQLILGQKDYQQCLILRRLVDQLHMPVTVVMCPIFREPNGLAMSSRNVRLTPELREEAKYIYQSLLKAAVELKELPVQEIIDRAIAFLNRQPGFQVDYFEILNAEDLQPVHSISDAEKMVIITSVIVGGVRLLDNVLVG